MKLLYQFSVGESFLHKVDPRSKMLFLAIFLFPLWTLPLPYPIYITISMVIVIWLFAGIKPNEYFMFIVFMLPIIFTILLIQLLTGPEPYKIISAADRQLVSLSISGFDTALKVDFRLLAMGIAFIGFSMTTDPFHWGMSLYKGGIPYKGAFFFGFAMRFFPLLQEELVIIGNALKARASNTIGSKNPFILLKRLGQMVIPLGLSSLNRSQSIALSMELRGFSIPEELGTERTLYREVAFSWRDRLIWLVCVLILFSTAFVIIGK